MPPRLDSHASAKSWMVGKGIPVQRPLDRDELFRRPIGAAVDHTSDGGTERGNRNGFKKREAEHFERNNHGLPPFFAFLGRIESGTQSIA